MIHIDVYIPAADEQLEFRCDETVPVSLICSDIYQILFRKYGGYGEGESGAHVSFWLCDRDNGHVLSGNRSLREEGIRNGSRLIFL